MALTSRICGIELIEVVHYKHASRRLELRSQVQNRQKFSIDLPSAPPNPDIVPGAGKGKT